jgi:dTDP-glucose pyrophosphorylase
MIENWKESLINPDTTIRACMRVIDRNSLKTAFVVDGSNMLIGSVSDGDIRRGLLKNSSMEDPVSSVMNRAPAYCLLPTKKSDIIKLLKEMDILCLPLLSDGKIVGIESLDSAQRLEEKKNPVFVMAGGFGTRLRPLTDNCPKPMLPVGEKPMLEHIIERLKHQGFTNFYLSTHYMPEVITEYFGDGSRWNVRITYVHESKPLGTAGALSLLPKDIPDLPMIFLNGDVLTDLNFAKLLDHHETNMFDATMCLREIEHQVSYGVVELDQEKVVGMREKPTSRHNRTTGIYVLSPSCYQSVKQNKTIDMPSLLLERIGEGKSVGAAIHPGYWLDIGRMADYQKAQRDILTLI